jgi:lipase
MVAPVGLPAKADDYKQGLLGHERHGPVSALPVIAAPGLTSHRAVWHQMIAHLRDTDVVAVDLRGRGASRHLLGPSSIGQHAVDLIDLADELGIERFVLAGHSLGAFVAAACAAAHPDRVAGLVLVDGGVTIPPPSATVDAGAKAAADLQAIVARLGQTFESYEAYHDFWRDHPALGPYWSDAIAGYMDADLCGCAPTLRPAANADRVMEDMADLYGAGRVDPFPALQVRTVILRAERGILDQPMGLYPAGYLQAVAAQQPLAQVREVEDVNHYTILLGDRGALQVAEALRDIVDDVS